MSLLKWLIPSGSVEQTQLNKVAKIEMERHSDATEALKEEIDSAQRQRPARQEAMRRLFEEALTALDKKIT